MMMMMTIMMTSPSLPFPCISSATRRCPNDDDNDDSNDDDANDDDDVAIIAILLHIFREKMMSD